MGFTYTEMSKKQLINILNEGTRLHKVVRKRLIGSQLWQVLENKETGERDLYVTTINKIRKASQYKYITFSYSENPYYYNCPFEFTSMVEYDTNLKRRWKQRYDEKLAVKTRPIKTHGVYELINVSKEFEGLSVKITSIYPLRGFIKEHNKLYRVKKSMLGAEIEE